MAQIETGSVFLAGIRRHAHAAGRLHFIETTVIAGLFGGLSAARIDEYGVLSTGSLIPGLIRGVVFAALWLAIGVVIYNLARESHRSYIANLLTGTGLLYLALEHDPHEALPSLVRHEKVYRFLGMSGPGLSFRQRMLSLLRHYSGCALGVGYQPFNPFWRRIEAVSFYGSAVVGIAFGYYIIQTMIDIRTSYIGGYSVPWFLMPVFLILILLIFIRATLQVARQSAVKLALCDILAGDEDAGEAVYSGGA